MSSLFLSFEGIEGSGKSTQAKLLADALRAQGREVIVTREPGGTALGQVLRRLLLEPSATPLARGAEVLMMLADRAQHVQEIIAPALQAERIVICDRFVDSTTAYQGYGREIPLDFLTRLNTFVCGGYMPDLTFLLDLPVDEGLRRARQRRGDAAVADHFEAEAVAFHERVHQGFLAVVAQEPQRVRRLDSTRPVDVTHQEILTVVQARLARQ